MSNIGEILANYTDKIVESWQKKSRQDQKLKSFSQLSDRQIEDSMRNLLKAMAAALSNRASLEMVDRESSTHGEHRAIQGVDTTEIAREYLLLRQEIFTHLQADLLKLSKEEIERTFRKIDTIIDEAVIHSLNDYVKLRLQRQKEIEQQLLLNNQELERSLRLNRESLSYLAHEFKTPLNSIMGYCQIILGQELPPSLTNELIERMLRSSRVSLELINDALELSRFESGKFKLNQIEINVVSSIESCLQVIEPLIKAKDLRLEKEFGCASIPVITDPVRLEQILINLLSNAVRYTEEGKIRVSCHKLSQQKWSIAIADTGIGIPQEELTRLFEPFYRASTNKNQGTGLGLAIAAKLIKFLQGEITVESKVGKGSSFTLTFPDRPSGF